jgi:murein L,D-transpeptidase YcbB/YkuD
LPVAAAVAARLSDGGDAALRTFYEGRGFAPLWLGGEDAARGRAEALIEALRAAPGHALPAGRYDPAGLASSLERARSASPGARAALELALTEAYLRYARDVSSGVLEPRQVDDELHIRPERPDPAALLARMAGAADPAAVLAALPPDDPDYDRLRARLPEYLRLARSGAWAEALPEGPSLEQGDRSERVVALRRRLAAMGDLEPATEAAAGAGADGAQVAANEVARDLAGLAAGDPALFDEQMRGAVERFQARHGLNTDGIVGPATRAALNRDPAKRARQIAVNLERLRWLDRDPARRHIVVNLAGFEMALVEGGKRVFVSRVAVGKTPRHRTPEFSDELEHMVVNPTWFVPRSIATEEILPKLRENPDYLAERNMRLANSPVDPSVIDWRFVTPATFPGSIRQGPGPGNALGKVKFMFPNGHAIYLHDTPQKHLFRKDRRTFSHGCVRVQEPFELARRLLEPQVEDPAAYFRRMVESGREIYVHLEEHVPVHITYRTAWVDADGADQFRGDVYERDARVHAALKRAGLDLFGG